MIIINNHRKEEEKVYLVKFHDKLNLNIWILFL